MRAWDAGRWLLLATLWSLQYIFMRLAVPTFGTAIVADGRAIFSALFLVPWMLFVLRQDLGLRLHWRDYLWVALVNNVFPFLCFAYAASGKSGPPPRPRAAPLGTPIRCGSIAKVRRSC